MRTQNLFVKENKFGKITKYQLLLSVNEDFGLCSKCGKNEQKLYLNLVKREIEKGTNKQIDDAEQYCYDCSTSQLTKLGKKNVYFKDFNTEQKKNFISSIVIELARKIKGGTEPSKFDMKENTQILNQGGVKVQPNQTENKPDSSITNPFVENDYIFDINKHRNYLFEKAENTTQKIGEKYGGKENIPFWIGTYKGASPKYNESNENNQKRELKDLNQQKAEETTEKSNSLFEDSPCLKDCPSHCYNKKIVLELENLREKNPEIIKILDYNVTKKTNLMVENIRLRSLIEESTRNFENILNKLKNHI